MKKIFALGLICTLFWCFAGIAQADVIIGEDFESGMPGDWTVIDGSWYDYAAHPETPDGYTWEVVSGAAFCGYGTTVMVDQLITPILDCSGYTDVSLSFDHIIAPWEYCGYVYVDIRIDGGSWTNLLSYTYPDDIDQTENIDISSYADEQTSIEIRWYNESISDGWTVDNVEITGTPESAPPVPLPFSEDFESGIPSNWTVIDNSTWSTDPPGPPDGVTWVVVSGVAISANDGYNPQNDHLITPVLDCSGYSNVSLSFDNTVAPNDYCGQSFVDIRIDGGSWTNLVTYEYPDNISENTVIDISSYADDQTSVEIRWFNLSISDNGWSVDNVEVTGTTYEHVGEGGPDIFGNIWKDNTVEGGPTFGYIDISSTGTVIGNGDDTGYGPYALGFSFPFYGTAYSEFNVNTNGLITMTTSTGSRYNYCPVPDEGAADFWIAPFWDDLNVRSDDGGNIYYQYFDAEIDYLVIQWHNFSIYGEYGDPMDMEVILYSNGNILFQYDYINALEDGQGQAATVGIEQDINDGLTYLCNDDVPGNRLYSGLAIGWYPPVINHDVGVVSIDDPTAPLVVTGAAVDVTATVSNYGTNSETFDVGLEVKNSSDVVVFTDTENITVTVGNSGQVAFDSWTVGDADDYSIIVTTLLSGDENAENDELASSITAVGVVSMPINQDFEGVFPPEGWTALDFGGESSWTTNTNHYHSPTHSAQASYDWMADTDDWLVMAPIDMSDGSNINWQYYEEDSYSNPFSENGLRHSFYVCTDVYFDPASLTPFVIHTPADHVIPDFTGDPIEFDLSTYAGYSHVWLAFRQENGQGPNTEYWWIDDVSVSSALTNDVGVYSIDLPASFIIENCDAPVEVTVKNYGLATQTFDVNVTITGDVLGEVYNQTVSVYDLVYGASEAVIFPDFIEPQADNYTIDAVTMLQSDENISNDALSGGTYVNTTIIHAWDDDETDGDMTPYPFDNTMLAVKYTPLATDFTILGGYVYVNNYNPDGNSYAEFEWAKICPDVAGAPDLDNPYGTLDNVGVYTVPILMPIDIPDVVVSDYTGDIWIVVKYWDDASEWLCMAIDTDDPDGYSYYNMYSDPPVWQQVTDRDYMMRIEVEYEPCIPAVGSIAGTVTDVFSRNPVGGATVNAWQDGSIVAYTTTETNGTYLLADLNTGLYDVEFIADGYYDYTEAGVLVESGALTTLDVVLHMPGSYSGTVSDFYGTPLDGVHVIATEFAPTMPLSEDFESGMPDNWTVVDGSTWSDPPGPPDGYTWEVVSGSAVSVNNGYDPQNDMLITPVLDCTDWTGVSLSYDHSIEPWEWSGYGLVDIRIDGGEWINLATYEYPANVNETANIDISSYADGQSSVEIRWYNYSISENGWTVDNISVTGSGPVALDWSEVVDVYTANGGQYTLILDPDKIYDIEYSMTDWFTQTVLGVDLEVDQVVNDANITLRRYGTLSGIVDDGTNPIQDVHVTVDDGSRVIIGEADTDVNGIYTIGDIPDGIYTVTFTHVDYEELIVPDYHIYENPPENMLDAELGSAGYEYVPGDCNMALGLWPPTVIGGDVTYLVGYFIGSGNAPCNLDGFWASADISGDCTVIGGDVSALVGYLIGTNPEILYCPEYPPAWLEGLPPSAPAGWPNCDAPVLNIKVIPTDSDK